MSEGGPKDLNLKLILVSVFLPSGFVPGGRNEDFHQESFFFFWLCCVAHGILILQQEIESHTSLKTQSLNHWTARAEVPQESILK